MMRNRLLLAVFGFGLSAFLMGSSTMAWFTASTSIQENTFTAGEVSIGAYRPDDLDDDQPSWSGDYDNLAPNQSVDTLLTIVNEGTLPMKYKMYASWDVDEEDPEYYMLEMLEITVTDPNDGDNVLFHGDLLTFNGTTPQDSTDPGYVVRKGPGDTGIAVDAEDELRVKIKMKSEAGNDAANKSVTITFHFDATQIGNSGWSQ